MLYVVLIVLGLMALGVNMAMRPALNAPKDPAPPTVNAVVRLPVFPNPDNVEAMRIRPHAQPDTLHVAAQQRAPPPAGSGVTHNFSVHWSRGFRDPIPGTISTHPLMAGDKSIADHYHALNRHVQRFQP